MAAGDSWDDPIIIGEDATTAAEVWEDFLNKRNSGNGKCMRFKDIHTTISGTGTQADPYKVSTYHEMLTATGATNIWQCKLIDYDTERPTAIRTYVYYDEANEIYKYCAYDPTPSIIDFNIVHPDFYDYIDTTNRIDVNGWTWLNLNVYCSQSGAFRCRYDVDDMYSFFRNLILLNCQLYGGGSSVKSMFSASFGDCIMQVDVEHPSTSILCWYYSGTSSNHNFNRCACKIKITAPNAPVHGGTYSGDSSFRVTNSVIDLDVVANQFTKGSGSYSFYGNRSIIKGKVKANSTGNYFENLVDCVFDVSDSEGAELKPPSSRSRSVFNKDKIIVDETHHTNWANLTGLVGVTSEQLLSPTALQAAGLSIGVDT